MCVHFFLLLLSITPLPLGLPILELLHVGLILLENLGLSKNNMKNSLNSLKVPTYKFHFDEPVQVQLSNEEPLNYYFPFIMAKCLTGSAQTSFISVLRRRGVKKLNKGGRRTLTTSSRNASFICKIRIPIGLDQQVKGKVQEVGSWKPSGIPGYANRPISTARYYIIAHTKFKRV